MAANVWGNSWGGTTGSWLNSWALAEAPPVVTDVSSLSLVNVSGLSSGTRLGCDELDAIYVGKGQRT